MDAAKMRQLIPTSINVEEATAAANRLRDGIAVLDLITVHPWDGDGDRARNAISWVADKLDLDIGALEDSLDRVRPSLSGVQS